MMDGFLEIVSKFINYIGKNIGMFILMCTVSYVTYIITMLNVNVEVERLEQKITEQEKYTNRCVNHIMDFAVALEESKK